MRLSLCFLLISYSVIAQTDVYTEGTWTDRDAWQRPREILRLLNAKEGSTIADIGCHEGYMTVKLSKAVGRSGKVYAVDVEQYKLNRLADHLARRNLVNVSLVKGDYNNPKLPLYVLDAVLILDAYHEMDEYDEILQHIRAALKPGGRLVICEPIADDRKDLSRSEQERRHELGIQFALEDLDRAGFEVIYKNERFVDRIAIKGDRMWVVVARK